VVLDDESPLPPYEQIRAGLAAAIGSGAMTAGTRLPPVRTLAQDLGIAAGTVARAYRELEQAGLVETRGRGGTVVSDLGDQSMARAREAAALYATTTRALGIEPDVALELLRTQLENR
jgi:DNA-binding transcriptional regulator YhcF (GntR family)